MRFEEHCDKSMDLFGDKGEAFHKWIDQYAAKYGWRHRDILHHKEGIEVGVQVFGEVCRRHLEQHVKDDLIREDVPPLEWWRKEVHETWNRWNKMAEVLKKNDEIRDSRKQT